MINKEVEKQYNDVRMSLENALEQASSIEVSGDEENVELSQIIKTLETLNDGFKEEIEKLKNSSEWDKFCIAFFGETNAGKSTVIESLRIIYDEETRRAEALAQEKKYHSALSEHCQEYEKLITSLEEVNTALKSKRGKKTQKILSLAFGVVGIAIGLVLANAGIITW